MDESHSLFGTGNLQWTTAILAQDVGQCVNVFGLSWLLEEVTKGIQERFMNIPETRRM